MENKQITLASSKLTNLKKVFRSIQSHGSISRKEIQADTELSWGATSQFTNVLLEAGIAVQSKSETPTSAKVPAEVELSSPDYLLIGLDLTSHYVCGILTNLQGDELLSRSILIADPTQVVEYFIMATRELLENLPVPDNVLAIGVSLAGNVDFENGILLESVFSDKWRNLKIREALEQEFHIPVIVRSDCECVLSAEYYLGNHTEPQSQSTILVNVNYGVGMAFRHKGKVFHSSAHHQGELGHITVVPNGTLCNCGKQGCLEMYASKMGITRQFEELVKGGASTSADTSCPEGFTYHSIRSCALQGDPLCAGLFQQCGRLLGNACANLATLLEPEIIIMYGDLLSDVDLWKDVFENTYYSNIFPLSQTKLMYSNLKTNAPALGAAFCALDTILNKLLKDALLSYTENHKKE